MWTGWASLGEARVHSRHWPGLGCPPPAPLQRRRPQGMGPEPPAPASPLPSALSPSWVGSRDRALLAGAVGRRGEGQGPGPRSQPCGLAWEGPGFAELGQRSREAGAPSQQAFMRHPVARRPSPRSHALVLPLTLPPKSAPHSGRTQESHQLPPLSRGPAAPRASLDGSLAAVSSSSSSSSSPSVNSSWPGP